MRHNKSSYIGKGTTSSISGARASFSGVGQGSEYANSMTSPGCGDIPQPNFGSGIGSVSGVAGLNRQGDVRNSNQWKSSRIGPRQ